MTLKMTRKINSVAILFFGFVLVANAQLDHALWSSLRLRYIPDAKNAFDFRPIVRHHENFSDYRNTSIDLVYRRKLSPHFTFGLLSRTWFIEGGGNRQFIWPTITGRKKIGKQIYESRFMIHWAPDIQDNVDADYLRIIFAINRPLSDKLTSRIAIEPWHQLNGLNKITRWRCELVAGYKFSDHYSGSIMYRRQLDDKAPPSFNNWMITLTYML